MRLIRLVLLCALVLAFAMQVPAVGRAQQAQPCPSSGYYVASLNADIDPGAANFMATTVSNAESICAGHLVFILTTNGGDGDDMESMIGSIESYQQWGGNFTTLIAPSGAFAFSAGSYISEASTDIYMVPGTTIGSATPIVSGIPTGETNTTLTKDINAFASYMMTLTASHDRNSTATQLMVTGGVSYTCASVSDCQALSLHVVNKALNATTLTAALSLLGVPASTPINTPGVSSVLISIISNPDVSSLLFLIGVFAIMADLFHPTVILSFIGAVMVVVALAGLGLFGASPLAILLMIVGAVFIVLEVKTQHGISATIGVITFIFGFLFIFSLPPAAASSSNLPPANFSGIPSVTYALIAALAVTIVIASLYLRSIRQGLMVKQKANDPARMIGKTGTMKSDLFAGGRGVALIGSEDWSVTADGELRAGDVVKVKEVKGVQLVVEKVQP